MSYKVMTMIPKALSEEQRNFIRARFIRSLREGNDWFKEIEPSSYYHSYSFFIEKLLSRPKCEVRLAVFQDEPDTILGWSLMEPNVLHYVYVKPEVRQQGVGKELTQAKINSFTHLTKIGKLIWKKRKEWKFDPFQ